MNAKIYSSYDIQQRVYKIACDLSCENIQKAKQGKPVRETDDQIFELMFIAEFLPYWNAKQMKQKECYINDKYNA